MGFALHYAVFYIDHQSKRQEWPMAHKAIMITSSKSICHWSNLCPYKEETPLAMQAKPASNARRACFPSTIVTHHNSPVPIHSIRPAWSIPPGSSMDTGSNRRCSGAWWRCRRQRCCRLRPSWSQRTRSGHGLVRCVSEEPSTQIHVDQWIKTYHPS